MDPPPKEAAARADKWLWSVRIFKTRSQAAQACRLHQVTIAGDPIKPSRLLRANDVLNVQKEAVTRTLKVVQVIEKRVSAKQAENFLDDLTPPEVWEKAREARDKGRLNRVYDGDEGGRPRKRDRRRMEAFESQDLTSD